MINIENCAGQKLRRLRLADCDLEPRVCGEISNKEDRTGTGLDTGSVLGGQRYSGARQPEVIPCASAELSDKIG